MQYPAGTLLLHHWTQMLPKIILKSFLLLSFKSRASLGVIGPGSTEEDKAAAVLV